ncbi:hypothetical protein PDL71_06240 [Lacibacter sp. MH-610]|uniref:hypothetical protein n=1 Tax=Lacibacter sp. MH-610 TaxID=3020883 RepID=UPI0038911C17
MIKNFETVRKQLEELSTVINSFKSENVQLKIIDLLFKGVKISDEALDNEEKDEGLSENTLQKRKQRRKKKVAENGEKKPRTSKGRPGPSQTLDKLVSEGYFKTKKTIGDIVKHCNTSLALTYKASDLSGILMKLVRDQKLKREKNETSNQYEYINA